LNVLNLVLLHPEIPHNTGAIGRLCVGLGIRLHLVQPLGFLLGDAEVKRAGLDYWPHLDLVVHDSWDAFLAYADGAVLHAASTRGVKSLYEVSFAPGDYVVFGSESSGLPEPLYEAMRDALFQIPMPGMHARSLNLANAASVVAYEAYRQVSQAGGWSGCQEELCS
jgi:tRNA (cytidine/uridine-2'-O-)-methyltransferase